MCNDIVHYDSVNVSVGEQEERMMMTGMHTVVDIFCVGCGSIVGWKYVRILTSSSLSFTHTHTHHSFVSKAETVFATFLYQEAAHEKSQKYKVGKYILERYAHWYISLFLVIG